MANPLLYSPPDTGVSAPDSLGIGEFAKTADYTIVAADNGKCFTNTGATGAVNFTLPAIAAGYRFTFFVTANQSVTVTSAESGSAPNIVTANTVAGKSVAFTTSGDKLGASLLLHSNAAGTLWYVMKTCSNALTIVT